MKKTYINPELEIELNFCDIITDSIPVAESGDGDEVIW